MSRTFHNRHRYCLLLLSLSMCGAASAQSVIFDYSSVGKDVITFTAAPPGTAPDASPSNNFQIEEAGSWGLDELIGSLTGTFTISPYYDLVTGVHEASVSGAGTLSIYGQSANPLAAGLASGLSMGQSGAFTNLKLFSYRGSDAALLSLVDGTTGVNTLSFQFIPGGSLASLASGGSFSSTTFSGSLVAIPEPPMAAALLSCSVLGVAILLRRRGMPPIG
jgi:hypothetical protein